jgi:hypothetical protein
MLCRRAGECFFTARSRFAALASRQKSIAAFDAAKDCIFHDCLNGFKQDKKTALSENIIALQSLTYNIFFFKLHNYLCIVNKF